VTVIVSHSISLHTVYLTVGRRRHGGG